MWSYDGWNQLNFVSQELKDPVRNFPIVICVGIPLGTDWYTSRSWVMTGSLCKWDCYVRHVAYEKIIGLTICKCFNQNKWLYVIYLSILLILLWWLQANCLLQSKWLIHRESKARSLSAHQCCINLAQTLIFLSAVATTFGAKVFKGFSWIVPLGVACSTFGAANGSAFTAARLSYAAGANGHFPKFLSYLSHSRLTPLMAVVFNCALRQVSKSMLWARSLLRRLWIAETMRIQHQLETLKSIIMIIPPTANIENLLDYFSFAMWLIYFLTFLSIIVMRYREPFKSKERPFRSCCHLLSKENQWFLQFWHHE